MLYAYTESGEKINATPYASGICPDCGEHLISKCGEIMVWHWAHQSGTDCDLWSEPESAWHLACKNQWPKECVEVPITKNGKTHRADVKTSRGVVIEFQHSHISTEDIIKRENFYNNMLWVFDCQNQFEKQSILLFEHARSNERGTYFKIKWKWPKKSICYCEKDVYLDFGEQYYKYHSNMFLLKKMNIEYKGQGWGYSYDSNLFLNRYGPVKQQKVA